MELTYKKLLEITINNKRFAIFMDNNKRKTFLEINSNGKYNYPSLEDYIYLNNKYNNKDPFIAYIPSFKYDEKVRVGSTLLSVVLIISGIATGLKKEYKIKQSENEVVIEEFEEPKEVNVLDSKFTEYFGYSKVSVDQIEQAILNNPNLDDDIKNISYKLLYRILSIDPNIDLKIFYENQKNLGVNIYTLEEIKAMHNMQGISASYNAKENKLNLTNESTYGEIVHENAHTATYIYRNKDGNLFYNFPRKCTFLDEAMNCEMASLVCDTYSYRLERMALKYFQTCIPFTISDYLTIGTDGLIDKLKNKYANIDIDYIIEDMEAIKDLEATEGIKVYFDDSPYLLDEIFKMALANIDLDNPYQAYTDFINLLDGAKDKTLSKSYLEKYNNYLSKLDNSKVISLSDIDAKIDELKRINCIAYNKDAAYPIKYSAKGYLISTMNDGTTLELSAADYFLLPIDDKIWNYMKNTIPIYYNTIGSSKYCQDLVRLYESNMDNSVKKTKIYLNDNLISEDFSLNYKIAFGVNSNGEVVYILKNNDNIIYQSDEVIEQLNEIDLIDYISDSNTINIDEYFNIYYLKYWLIGNPNELKNISFANGSIIYESDDISR